ncbi:MAG: TonB family protein [Candidatus Eremiobacter antarcticus]
MVSQSSGNSALDKAALQAAQASRFRPPTVNGVATTRQYKIEYVFQLD